MPYRLNARISGDAQRNLSTLRALLHERQQRLVHPGAPDAREPTIAATVEEAIRIAVLQVTRDLTLGDRRVAELLGDRLLPGP